jgi:hypothetical protein
VELVEDVVAVQGQIGAEMLPLLADEGRSANLISEFELMWKERTKQTMFSIY